jgi:type II secretory pathway component PulM
VKEWFLRFSTREQLALLVMGVVVLVYLAVVLLVLPIAEARRELMDRNSATAEVLVRVDRMAAEIRELRENAAGPDRAARRNLTALVNSSAERFGLRASRLQPSSSGAVQVRFESAPLPALLRWIHDLETSRGLAVEDLSVSQTATAGTVSVSARIAALN